MPIPRLHKETPLYSKVRSVGAYLKLLADSIVSLVQMDETYTDPSGNTVTNHAASLIKQNADNILLRVEKNGVISSINQSSEEVTINASRVNIEGAAMFTTGKLSKVLKTTNTQWYSSTSRTELVGGEWSTTQPTITAGHYLWQREYMTYSNGDNEYKPSENGVCVTPDTEAVKSVDVEYAQNQSRTSAPTGASDWSTTAPTYRSGWYIWTRTKTVTASGTTYTAPTCISGRDGADAVSPYEYSINASPAALVRAASGALTPNTITFSATRAQGTGSPSAYNGRFVISEFDGTSWSNKYTSASNESSKVYGPSATAKVVRCNLYLAGGTSTLVDTQSVGIASDGATGSSVTVTKVEYAYQLSTSGTTVPTGTWSTTPVAPTTTQYAWTRTTTTYSDGSTAKTYTVGGRAGATGGNGTSVTITSTAVTYQSSTSGTDAPTGPWSSDVPSVSQGSYLWTRTVVQYSDGSSTTSYSVGRMGENGAKGSNGYNTATVFLYQRRASTPAKPSNTLTYTFATHTLSGTINNGWSTTIPSGTDPCYVIAATATSTEATDTIASSEWSTPIVLAQDAYSYDIETYPAALVRSEKGALSPSTVTFYAYRAKGATYAAYAGRFVIAEHDGSSWVTKYTSSSNESSKAYSPTSTARIVRCELYLAGGTTTLVDTQSVPIASDGATGDSAYTVMLTNESHTFAAGTSAAVAGLATTNVIALKGSTRQKVTVGTITGAPTGMTTSVSSNGSTAPTVAINVTTSLVTRSGTLSIPVTVDGNEFTLVFSWSLALTGARGATGAKGATGDTGADGLNQATIYLYQRAASSPTPPSSALTYTFSDGSLSGTLGSWTRTVPTANGNPCWVTSAVAISSDSSDSIASSEWSTPTKLVEDGEDGADGYTVMLTNESHTFAASTDAAIASSTTTQVIAFKGTSQVAATIGTVSGKPTGMSTSISNNGTTTATLTVSVTTSLTTRQGVLTVPVTVDGKSFSLRFSWSLALTGATGNGINSVTVTYGTSTSASTMPTSWSTTLPTVAEGSFLWTRTVTDYTDPNTEDTVAYSYAKQGAKGAKGATGTAGTSITVSAIAYQIGASATTAPTGTWSSSPVDTTTAKPYLWTRTTFSDSSVAYGVAKRGDTGATGADGVGITSITEQYYLSTSNTTRSGGSWVTTPPEYVSGRYYWTRSKVVWTDGTTTYTDPVLANGLNGALTLAHGAYNSGAGREQYIWFAAVSGTNSLSANTTWVTETGDVTNKWTAIRPTYSPSYPVIFMAKQKQTVAQLSGTACSCTTPTKDTTTTHINGAQITTGTIDASKVTVENIDASKISSGYLSAARINSKTITLDKLANTVQNSIANGVTAYQRQTAYRGTCSSDPYSNAKDVYCTGLGSDELVAGVVLSVYFTTFHVYQEDYLHLNVIYGGSGTNRQQSGYIQVKVGGETVSQSNQLMWTENTTLTFVYDGTYWQFADSAAEVFGSCSTAASTADKVADVGPCILFRGTMLTLAMTYRNTASAPTLNVSSLGAKSIYYGTGTSTRPTVANGKSWLNGTMAPFTFDGRYWRFGTRTYIDGGDIVANSITATQIAANTITANEISSDYVYAGNIKASQITSGTISGDKISGGTISSTTFENTSGSYKVKIASGKYSVQYGTYKTLDIWGNGAYGDTTTVYIGNKDDFNVICTLDKSGASITGRDSDKNATASLSVSNGAVNMHAGNYYMDINNTNGIKLYYRSGSTVRNLASWS